jgi:hypothetical protein
LLLSGESLNFHDDLEDCGSADDEDEKREKVRTDGSFAFVRFFLEKKVKNRRIEEIQYQA